jgi:hypothetical protein
LPKTINLNQKLIFAKNVLKNSAENEEISLQRWADRYFGPLVRWSAAQRTTEMLADQRTGKNSGPAPADYRN